MNLNKTNYILF